MGHGQILITIIGLIIGLSASIAAASNLRTDASASNGPSYASCVPGSKCDQFIGAVGAALSPYKSTPGFWSSALNKWISYNPLTSSFNDLPPQAHSGDLLEHVKWSALQLARWCWEGDKLHSKQTSAWSEGIDCDLAVAASFLHDVGKGGDCSFECIDNVQTPPTIETEAEMGPGMPKPPSPTDAEETESGQSCFASAYGSLKYANTGQEWKHPILGAEMMQGKPIGPQFYTKCPTSKEYAKMNKAKSPYDALQTWLSTNGEPLDMKAMMEEAFGEEKSKMIQAIVAMHVRCSHFFLSFLLILYY
jgi:hypothetical protein